MGVVAALAQCLQGHAHLRRLAVHTCDEECASTTASVLESHLTSLTRLTELSLRMHNGWCAVEAPGARCDVDDTCDNPAASLPNVLRRVTAASRLQSLHRVISERDNQLTGCVKDFAHLTSLALDVRLSSASALVCEVAQLTHLRRVECSFTGALWLVLPPPLTHLSLTRRDAGSGRMGLQVVECLQQLSQLVELKLSLALGSRATAQLGPALALLTRLRVLQLNSCELGSQDVIALAPHLSRLTQLQSIGVTYNGLQQHAARALGVHLAPLAAMGLTAIDLRMNLNPHEPWDVAALGASVAKVADVRSSCEWRGKS